MDEYLAFVDEVGRTLDGKYIYRFDFTVDKDTVWGDFFNVAPTAIIPDLQPDVNSLSKTSRVIFSREMTLAKKNYCFSMQDCIDGLIPLIFSEIDDDTLEYNGAPFFLRFGEPISRVEEILQSLGIKLTDIEEIQRGDDSAIDALIDSGFDNDDDEDDLDPDF